MAAKKRPARAAKKAEFVPTVDRLLVALQKTLSRVSRDSASVPEGKARSLIVGNVDFSVDLQCELEEGEQLRMDPEGSVYLQLSGRLATDHDVQAVGEDSNGGKEEGNRAKKAGRSVKAGKPATGRGRRS